MGTARGRSARAVLAVLTGTALTLATAAPGYADATRDAQWYASYLKFDKLHAVTQGEGVTVAIIDTGVDANHPDLTGNVLPGLDAWSAGRDGRADSIGHGTSMASLIAGHGHGTGGRDGVLGVAPKARILPVGAYPPGATQYKSSDLAVGIRWAVDHGAQVILMALGGSSDQESEDAVKYALSKNVTLVAGAGNKPAVSSITFPAAYPGVIAVSATDRSGAFARNVSVSDFAVLLSAPGQDIVSAAPGGRYGTASGTSDASALVAGAAALLKAKHPELTNQQVFQQLKATAVDKGPAGHDDEFGYGLIDPLSAVTKELPAASAPAGPTAGDEPPVALPEGRSTTMKVLLSVLLIAGWLAVLGAIVALVVWLVRRRRRNRSDCGDRSDRGGRPGGVPPGPPSPPGPPTAVQEPGDADQWRRPNSTP